MKEIQRRYKNKRYESGDTQITLWVRREDKEEVSNIVKTFNNYKQMNQDVKVMFCLTGEQNG